MLQTVRPSEHYEQHSSPCFRIPLSRLNGGKQEKRTKGLLVYSPAASLSPWRLLASEDEVERPKNFLPALSPASLVRLIRKKSCGSLDLSMSNLQMPFASSSESISLKCLPVPDVFSSQPGWPCNTPGIRGTLQESQSQIWIRPDKGYGSMTRSGCAIRADGGKASTFFVLARLVSPAFCLLQVISRIDRRDTVDSCKCRVAIS